MNKSLKQGKSAFELEMDQEDLENSKINKKFKIFSTKKIYVKENKKYVKENKKYVKENKKNAKENMNIINKNNTEFAIIVKDIITNPEVKKMNEYRQHYNTSCMEHCIEVAYISYLICKKFNLDYVSVARAGILHDFFLYDWRMPHKDKVKGKHAFSHPRIALNNSKKFFELNEKEQDIILKHMWPVTLFKFPRYKETFIITLIDKYSALRSFKKYYVKYFRLQNLKTYIKPA